MDFVQVIIILLIVGVFVFLAFLFKKMSDLKKPSPDAALLEWLKSMQKSIETTNRNINDSLSTNSSMMVKTLQENSRQLNERMDRASAVIAGVGREIGEMSEIGRNMKELQDFLKSPKLRGNIGEHVLRDLIEQIFPKKSFFLQYQFKSGEKVDAAIRTDGGILPIDSKFPMENFNKIVKSKNEEDLKVYKREFGKDMKKHIDAIASKYIVPDEGTMDFALMYVPSEAVFYEVVNMDNLMDYARERRVYVVSPSTLYAHLQTILLSFEGKRIEDQTKQVMQLLRALRIDYEKVNDSLGVLGRHIGNASNQYGNVQRGFEGVGRKLESVKDLGGKKLKGQGGLGLEEE